MGGIARNRSGNLDLRIFLIIPPDPKALISLSESMLISGLGPGHINACERLSTGPAPFLADVGGTLF
jgi:hypothetical protein